MPNQHCIWLYSCFVGHRQTWADRSWFADLRARHDKGHHRKLWLSAYAKASWLLRTRAFVAHADAVECIAYVHASICSTRVCPHIIMVIYHMISMLPCLD
jgi:hypothetical protein